MSEVVIFKNDGGGVSVIYPSQDALDRYGIDGVAAKDVPEGKPYKILSVADLPSRDQRDLWTVDEADLTDGVGGPFDVFEETN